MYEHLPVPFGLVRFGVAPDHPEVKNCQDKFSEVAESPNFNFIGNISIGIILELYLLHHRTLNIPGEDNLKGIYSARAFVGWYNGLPEYADLEPDLTQGDEAIVIGQGNVALDVARILLQDPDVLRTTDITERAIETLQKSRVTRVRVVGRRGPLQAAFTIKEVHPFDPAAKANGTGELIGLPASLAFRSIGYKSEALPGFSTLDIPFDDRMGIIPNDSLGRVVNENEGWSSSDLSKHVSGMYCAGWVKRGPTGVIASTMLDAFSTADTIAEDWYARASFLNGNAGGSGLGWDGVKAEADKKGCRRVSWEDWHKIDAVERKKGHSNGKEREKFTKVEDMLKVLD
ncbi:hypothetical protein DID88_006281 [Monilinia fructigena]|uniref:Adrenodoxin-NADP(+) reductase n=1 Tax=Monilinia fructigena TaxID=38457 RepID=A0A395J2L7_9HELO|nr:hypothetical protein DID88_006281 [Monilinia fructigena]